MRRIVTAISAAALAFGMVSSALPANALTAGFDSAWARQTAYLDQVQGTRETNQVFFDNTGTSTWTKGTSTEVALAVCLEDKVTCSVSDPSEAPFNPSTGGWESATIYASQTQTSVAPGGRATFTFDVLVPANQAAGIYRFNGDLIVKATGDRIHPEGYFHQVNVKAAAVASCTPTAMTTSPTAANRQVGSTHTQTATVDCDPPTGSTTRPKASGAQVTFSVDAPAGSLNADLNLTATTNADGVASVSWSRLNPDKDDVSAFPTAQPAVRATATIRWLVAAAPIDITPDTAATQKNDTCRAYTVKTQSLTTGAAASRKVLLNFSENSPALTGTTDNDKGAFFKIPSNGVSQGNVNKSTYNILSTDSTGSGTFDVCGPGGTTNVGVTPVGFYDESDNGARDTGEDIQDTGGKVTFETAKATITLTPDTTATNATGGARQYTVTAVDQFGSAFLGELDLGFSELTDDSTTTTTSAVITWKKVGGSAPTTTGGCAGTPPTATSQPASTDTVNATKTEVLFTVGNTTAFFAVCSTTNNDTGTPVAWQDIDSDDDTRQTGEPQDTGGAITWKTAAVTTASLSPASATNASSTESAISDNGSLGEEKYTVKIVDQSGNQLTPGATTTVVFTIKNTSSSGNVFISECNGTSGAGTISAGAHATGAVGTTSGTSTGIAPGSSGTCTATLDNTSTATASVEIDKAAAGSATIDCTATIFTTIPSTQVCNQSTKTWVDAGSSEPAADTTVTGDVVAFDKTQDTYTVKATVGNFTINYQGADQFTVDGTVATPAQFETNITIGDSIKWTRTGAVEKHELTNK